MGTSTKFRIPRQLDRQVIASLQSIGQQAEIPKSRLRFRAYDGAPSTDVPFDALLQNEVLKEVLSYNEAALINLALIDGASNRQYVVVERRGSEYCDEVQVLFEPSGPRLSDLQFARLLAVAKKELKEARIDGAMGCFASDEANKYYEARDATLTRLETISTELLFKIHEREKQLDADYQNRVQQLEGKLASERESLKKEFEQKEKVLVAKDEAIKAREAEFETHESKYLRRQLRMDMLKKLEELSKKFQLTQGTRRLRWPIVGFVAAFLAFCGTMSVLVYLESMKLLDAVGQDVTNLQWWKFGFLGIKQLGFLAAFLAGSWFFIKWNDRWFRQHADAEFMFKQLELDINRASWVVEMTLEWTKEKGTEIPPELLEHLAHNLFKHANRDGDDGSAPTDLASLILGAATSVKMRTPSGARIELDHKGLSRALKESAD